MVRNCDANSRMNSMILLRTLETENPHRLWAVTTVLTTLVVLFSVCLVNEATSSGESEEEPSEPSATSITRSAAGLTIESLKIKMPDLSIDGGEEEQTGEQSTNRASEDAKDGRQTAETNTSETAASEEPPLDLSETDPMPQVRKIILDPVPNQADHLLQPADMRRRIYMKLLFEYRLWKVNEQMNLYRFPEAHDHAKALYDRLSGTFLEEKAQTVLRRVKRASGKLYRSVRNIAQQYVDREQYEKAQQVYVRYRRKLARPEPWDELIKRDQVRIAYNESADWIRKQKRESRRISRKMHKRYKRKRRRERRRWREKLREERRNEFINETALVADIPSGNNYASSQKPVEVTRKGTEHFRVRMKEGGRDAVGWFMWAFEGFPDRPRRVRVDLVNVPEKWHSVNPVVSAPGVEDLSDPEHFRFQRRERPMKLEEASNGSMLPPTDGQKWRYMQDVRWKPEQNTLTTYARVQGDRTYFAMRVPYTSDLNEQVMEQLGEVKRDVRVHRVGTSPEDHPLYIAQIGGTRGEAAKKQPCVVLVCQEHPDEHLTGQFGFQTIHALLDLRKSNESLRNTTFLIIPQLDPLGTDRNYYSRITRKFNDAPREVEHPATQRAYVSWFREWATEGNRLTMVVNMHNIEGGERDIHFFPGYLPGGKHHRHTGPFLSAFVKRMESAGFSATAEGEVSGMMSRLGGFIHRYMGAPHMLLELNSQASSRHLILQDLYLIGALMVRRLAAYLHSNSPQARKLYRYVYDHRRYRSRLVERYAHLKSLDQYRRRAPIPREEYLWALPALERLRNRKRDPGDGFRRRWIRKLYEKDGISPSNIPEPFDY